MDHRFEWDYEPITRTYEAHCSCGWVGRWAHELAVARALHGEHLAYLLEGPRLVR